MLELWCQLIIDTTKNPTRAFSRVTNFCHSWWPVCRSNKPMAQTTMADKLAYNDTKYRGNKHPKYPFILNTRLCHVRHPWRFFNCFVIGLWAISVMRNAILVGLLWFVFNDAPGNITCLLWLLYLYSFVPRAIHPSPGTPMSGALPQFSLPCLSPLHFLTCWRWMKQM